MAVFTTWTTWTRTCTSYNLKYVLIFLLFVPPRVYVHNNTVIAGNVSPLFGRAYTYKTVSLQANRYVAALCIHSLRTIFYAAGCMASLGHGSRYLLQSNQLFCYIGTYRLSFALWTRFLGTSPKQSYIEVCLIHFAMKLSCFCLARSYT